VRARLATVLLAVAASAALVSASNAGTHAAADIPRCDVNDERYTYLPSQGAAGTMYEKFRISHRGKRPRCTLKGYPSVDLLDKHGRSLGIKVRRDRHFKVKRRVLKKGNRIYFWVHHPSFERKTGKACPHKVYKIRVRLPRHSKSVTFKGFDPVRFCDDGARKTPFRAKSTY
jgi:hypothetical protein